MEKIKIDLSNLSKIFPTEFTQAQKAKAQTLFLKKLSEKAHRFYGGKMQTVQKLAYMALIGSMFGTLQVYLKFQQILEIIQIKPIILVIKEI